MSNSFKETVRVVAEANEKYKPEHDMFFPKDVHPPKPWFSKQFILGFEYATALYGIIAVLVIIYLRYGN